MAKFNRGNSSRAKLTPEQILEIYRRYSKGESQASLCRDFQISIGQMGRICRGEVWQELYRRFTEGLPLDPHSLSMHFAVETLEQEKFERKMETAEFKDEIAKSAERLMAMLEKDGLVKVKDSGDGGETTATTATNETLLPEANLPLPESFKDAEGFKCHWCDKKYPTDLFRIMHENQIHPNEAVKKLQELNLK